MGEISIFLQLKQKTCWTRGKSRGGIALRRGLEAYPAYPLAYGLLAKSQFIPGINAALQTWKRHSILSVHNPCWILEILLKQNLVKPDETIEAQVDIAELEEVIQIHQRLLRRIQQWNGT